MSLKSLLGRGKPKVKSNDKAPKPEINGKWKIMEGNELIARIRVVTSLDPNFAHGQKLFQIYDEGDKRYSAVAFIQPNGNFTMFKPYKGKSEEELLNAFIDILSAGGESEGFTVVEVHQESSFYNTVLGRAITAWKEAENVKDQD